ncbi:MAG: carbon-nitrogen hydrolase family protein [Anaerolineae bacterium]
MTMLNIALAQMRCEKGAIAENFSSIAEIYAKAVERDVEIVGFPEMSLTGYIDPTHCPEAILTLDGPDVARVTALTEGQSTDLLFGIVEANPQGKPFITQIATRNGECLGHYRKLTIKDEEADWFSPGEVVPIFQRAELTYAVAICADVRNREVYAAAAEQGAEIIFELAAPGLYGDQETRDWQSGYAWWEGVCQENLSTYAQDFGLWIAVVTQAGRTVDEDFPGGGYVFAPSGERVFATSNGRPGVAYLSLDLDAGTVTCL